MGSLLKACEFDGELIARLLSAHGFESHFRTTMGVLARKRTVLERHGVRWAELRKKLGTLL